MTIVSLKAEKTQRDGTVKAEFSDGSSLLFATGYLPEELRGTVLEEPGRELPSGEEEAFRYAAACYRAEKAALRLIARAEQNSLTLTAKLERRGYNAAVTGTVVSYLQDQNFINDRRYAELWIRSRLTSRRVLSPRWLLVSLGKRGIDRNHSRKALAEALDPEIEYSLLLRYIEKAKPGNMKIPEAKREKFLRAQLKYEGFSLIVLERYFNN